MSEKFKDYVTSTAFNLTLSRPMIECLCQMEKYGSSWVNANTFYALQHRGLAERVNEFSDLPETVAASLSPRISLTEAGRAVIPLLKLAGLYIVYPDRPSGIDIPAATVSIKEQNHD